MFSKQKSHVLDPEKEGLPTAGYAIIRDGEIGNMMIQRWSSNKDCDDGLSDIFCPTSSKHAPIKKFSKKAPSEGDERTKLILFDDKFMRAVEKMKKVKSIFSPDSMTYTLCIFNVENVNESSLDLDNLRHKHLLWKSLLYNKNISLCFMTDPVSFQPSIVLSRSLTAFLVREDKHRIVNIYCLEMNKDETISGDCKQEHISHP